MLKLIRTFAQDEQGAILNSAELVFLATILAIGVLPGVTILRDAIVREFASMAAAVNPNPQPGPVAGPVFGANGQVTTAGGAFANQ